MYIKLFDFEGGKIIPSIHCYQITWLKKIMDKYPTNYIKIYSYIHYVCSWNPDDNPYLLMREEDREETIARDLEIDFSLDDDVIQEALDNAKKLFELPAYRAWQAAKASLQALTDYQLSKKVKDGKDGNITQLMSLLKELPSLIKSFNEAYKNYIDSAKIALRGDRFNSQV
jgi:hypothetical protein